MRCVKLQAWYSAPMLETLDHLIHRLDQGSAADAPEDLGPGRPLVLELLQGPAPRESLLALRRLLDDDLLLALPAEGPSLKVLAAVLSGGPDLSRLLAQDPQRMRSLLDPGLLRPQPREELEQPLDACLEGITSLDRLALAVTRFRNDQYVRLAACEFGQVPLEQVGRQLAQLADVCLDRTLSAVMQSLAQKYGDPVYQDASGVARPCGLAALAMGKHGGMELNFCSDIDLIFIYHSDEGAAGELSLNAFFSRVCQQVVRVLSEPNEEGFCFKVDLRLRPEGSIGPICNSLSGAERYYETWGGPWDRLAWIKARAAAGDLDLGRQMIDILRPFVFPRSTRPEIIEQLQELNRRIKAGPQGRHGDWNVKLGKGGIREVEFFVQALQLLHAGKQDGLQVRSTLEALDRLLFCGLMSEQEQRELAEAYDFWRHIEHRLQIHAGRQTHSLPSAGPLRRWVAAHLGQDAPDFDERVMTLRHRVEAIYATLGGGLAEDGALASLLDSDLPAEEARAILQEQGFAEPERAAEHLRVLADKPWGPLGSGRARALPVLAELVRSPDPDAALQHLTLLALRFGPFGGLWEMLEQNHHTLRLLLSLFGSSDYLARMFIDHPELLDKLLMVGRARRRRTVDHMRRELAERLALIDPADQEAALNVLRHFRNEEVLRVGLHDIAGALSADEVWEQLSSLADVILGQTYPLALADAEERYGCSRHEDGSPAVMAVLGLGKLGGRELTYGSDLDLIFIYSGAGATDGSRPVDNGEFFARVAQRMIRALSADLSGGRLYEVDMRLRPSGNQGALVSSQRALAYYHEHSAGLWERQALIKARAVAGDPDLGLALEQWRERTVFGAAVESQPARDSIRRLRERMHQERSQARRGFLDLKLGQGGLVDIEFIVQYLQLCHGFDQAGARARSTTRALAALAKEGVLDSHTYSDLLDAYRFLRRLEGRLRIVRDRPAGYLPATGAGLEVMARRLGYRRQGAASPGEILLQDYQEQAAVVGHFYQRILVHEP